MTLPKFTPDGIQVQTFQEIYDELAAGYRSIYGEDINLDPDSPDGQRVAIEAQLVLDAQRSEERRVGKECRYACRSRWSPYH